MRSLKGNLIWRITGVIVALSMFLAPAGAAATSGAWVQTSRADFESGALMQLDTAISPGDVRLAISGVDYLYAFRGYNQKSFRRYSLSLNSWSSLADAPDTVSFGGSLAYDGANGIYALRGNNSNNFWRYNISSNNWSVMVGTPAAVTEGGALTYCKGNLYALRGNDIRDFWRYDIAAAGWTSCADTSANVCCCGALTSDGVRYIYTFQGNCQKSFWRYDTLSNSWTAMADAPEPVSFGGSLTYDDNRYIYALSGWSNSSFWQYDIPANTWTAKAGTPRLVGAGGSLAFTAGNQLFAFTGDFNQYFWRYNVFSDSWDARHNTPASVSYGAALVRGAPTYYASGNLTSVAYDTGYYADFGSLSWTLTAPAGTVVKFQVAANNDNATWLFKGPDGAESTYYTSSGAAIWAGLDGNRYIKYKAFFTTADTRQTPVLHDITITYTKQVLLPVVTTLEANPVEETTATLHGILTFDGREPCQYRFQYGTASGNYTQSTDWTGSLSSGVSFSVNLTGLSKGKKYYFQAQSRNSVGTASGGELALLTKPDPPVSFTAKAVSDTQINLNWVNGEGALRTMIRRKAGDFPADRDDGTQVYFDTGTSFADTGLKPGMAYYYSAWSEVTGSQRWSDISIGATATTSALPPVAVGGSVFKVNKAQILAPWLAMLLFLLAGSGAVIRWRLKA